VLTIRRLGVCRSFHISLWGHSMTPGKESKRHRCQPSQAPSFVARGLLEAVPRTAGRLANGDAEHPTNRLD
jgi:hypothetical protein